MALGFKGAAAVAVFDPPMRARSRRMERNGRDGVGQVAAQAGARTRGTLPAQAQVAAWVRPVRAKRKGPSHFLRFWAKTEKIESGFCILFFQKIEKWKLAQKKIFPCG